jgi:hypothetical protein
VAPVLVTCPASASSPCAGTITVDTKPVRAKKTKRKRRLRLGSRNVRVRPGSSKTVRIKIPRRHRPILKRLKTVRVRVTVSPAASPGTARKSGVTLRTSRIAAG